MKWTRGKMKMHGEVLTILKSLSGILSKMLIFLFVLSFVSCADNIEDKKHDLIMKKWSKEIGNFDELFIDKK